MSQDPFGDLKDCSEAHLRVLDDYLESHSYLKGYELTTVDIDACDSLMGRKSGLHWPDFPHLDRWRNHINSFNADVFRKVAINHA